MSSNVLTEDFFIFALMRDSRDNSFKRIKKALKSNQKQLDLRAMRHFDIILAKKPVSSNCPHGTFGEPKKPCKSRVFGIPWCHGAKPSIVFGAKISIVCGSGSGQSALRENGNLPEMENTEKSLFSRVFSPCP